MNKIYKVIWSKAKHTYVVASEIAKGHTKGETTGRGLKKLAAALLVAAALLSPSFTWAADPIVTVTDKNGVEQTVYTETGANETFATINNLSTVSTEVQTQATEINTNTTNINGLTTRVNALESSKTDTALHISSSGDLIVGTKENQTVKDMEIRGKLTSGSISTGGITSTGDVTVAGKMAADGVTDETTKDGTYIKQNNTVGNNLVSLDTQVKANADAIAEKVNAADVYTKDETDQKVDAANTYTYRKVATEEKAREAADKALDDRITNVKEYLEKQTSDNYVSKADAAVQDGAIVKAANTIGENVTNLDAALAKETAARLGADAAQDKVIKQVNDNLVASVNTINKNVADGFTALNQADANEAAAREAKDNELNERITNEANGIHDEIKAGDKALDDRITNVKEYLEKQTSDTYVSKDDAAVQNGAIVKADKTIGENVTNLDAALAKETAARIGADKAQDAVIQQVNQNAANGIATLATAYNNEVASREAADNELNERITNEANAIHETTNKLQDDLNTETTAREAADTALDTRITNVKEYLENQTSENYVSKTDATVQDGAIVKAAKTIGENVTNLDAALAKETAARIGADKAQDEVIKQVNQNVADGFNTINTNMANGFAALNAADAAEKEARIGADKKLAEAVNSGLSLRDDNVLQKNTTTVADDGTVTTSKSDANEMILNKGNKNQITLNEKGVKVGTNSSVLDADGIYTGGDTFDAAKAAMSSDGQIKGANGKFTVDASGNTTVTSLDAGTGTIQTKGDLYAKDATFSGDITAKDATLSGDLSAKDGTFSGDLSAKDGTFSGDVSAKDVTATGTLQGAEVTDGTATLKQGKLTGVKDIETEALHVNGDANVTGKLTTKDLEVTGEFNANTLKSRLDENNYTEIHGGNVTSKNLKVDKGVTRTSESSFDENGREEYVTDNDSRATVKVGANEISQTLDDKWDNPKNAASRELSQNMDNKYEITDSVVEGNQSNVENRTADTTDSQISFKDDSGKVLNKSYITQNLKKVLMGVEEGDNKTTIEQDANNIINTAKNGTITNDAGKLVNTASESVTTQIGDGSEVQSVMNGDGIANKATGKSITNDAATITNTGTTSVTNQVGNNKVLVDTTHVQSAFGDTIYTTWDESGITNNATDKTVATNAKNIQNTATGDITNTASTGTITNDAKTLLNKASDSIIDKVGANVERTMTTKKISESVKDGDGTKSNSNTFTKTAKKDINIITDGTNTSTLSQLADSVNTSLKNGTQSLNNTKTVTEDVTKVTDENTGAFSSSSQKADAMTNTVKNGSKSNTVTETASTSEQKLVSGNIIDILKDAENGYVNTTVSNSDGSSSTGVKQTYTDITSTAKQGTITNDAKNLVNKAEEKLSNSAAEIENTATTSIKDTVGKSTVTTTTDGTTFENTDHNVAIGYGSITKTTISGNTLETGKATMDYAEVMKDLRVGGTTTTEDLHVTNNATIDGTLDVTGAANFQNKVTVAKDLSVGGDVTADSYKVGDKTYIDKDGINANNQVIRNVGQGDISEGSTDAVSGGQLYETNTRVSGLETRMGTVETRVDKLDNKIDKVGANAAAMANLHPLEFDEDSKWNVAAAVGSSGSETASAVGVFYRPNENVMVNASAAMGTGENMFGGGVSLRLGHGGNKAKEAQMKAAAAENKELRAKVDDLTARMDALLSVLNPNMSKDFPDVPENHWAYEAVSRLAGNGIVEGYEDGKYHGERQMTRYEMAEIIYNALSKGAKAEKKLVEEFRPELQAMAAQKKA